MVLPFRQNSATEKTFGFCLIYERYQPNNPKSSSGELEDFVGAKFYYPYALADCMKDMHLK